MPRPIPALVFAAAVAVGVVRPAAAAQAPDPTSPVTTRVSLTDGHVFGVVRDDAGSAIRGASIIALGTTAAVATTDARGRFTLALLPGEYVLRASHNRYISTYREPVRVRSSVRIEREITLLRPGQAGIAPIEPDHSHTEAAWRLRHLPRTVLRDTSGTAGASGADLAPPQYDSLLDRVAALDFTGQVNVLTSSAGLGAGPSPGDVWPRGVAYVAVGAQAGTLGDWRIRAAVSGGLDRPASWVMLGELFADEAATHAYRVGVSYGAQPDADGAPQQWQGTASGSRGVAGIYALDRWRVRPGLMLDYGVRLDRYDYLARPELLSPHIGGRVAILPRTSVTAQASRRLIAPGADEFLPPPDSGPWMPPERSFSSLVARAPLRAEDVRHLEVGVEQALFDDEDAPRLVVRRFRQATRDQAATIFGVDASRDVGHYYVATPGDVELDGWGIGVRKAWNGRILTAVDYSLTDARWDTHRQARGVRRVAPSAVRGERERLHDVTASVDAHIPESDTRLTVVVRTNSGFAGTTGAPWPVFGGRFDVEVRQALPYQPFAGGRFEVLVAIRSLYRDARSPVSVYDEVLTVAPPLRLVGGVQIRF
jgi:hypothetical protein